MPQHKYVIGIVAAVGLSLLYVQGGWSDLFGVPEAFAQVTPVSTETEIANIVSKAITVLNVLAWILFAFMSFLLDPTIIFDLNAAGQDGPFMQMLNSVWQLSRDLMNIAFAFMLIGAAIYTILKANKDFLAEYAPKFLLAIILVNFSWFFPRVILDVANVTAAAIYGIPSLLAQNPQNQCVTQHPTSIGPDCVAIPNSTTFRCQCRMVVDVEFFVDDARLAQLSTNAFGYECLTNLVCFKKEVMTPATVAGYSAVINGLIVNHARMGELARVPAPPVGSSVSKIITFLIREALILLIHIALVFPLLAMFIAFLIRIPVLWMCMAFMPFMFLDMVAGEKLTQGYAKKIWEMFLKAAFLPALVAVPFTIGYMLLNAGMMIDMSAVGIAAMNSIPLRLFDGTTNLYQILWLCMALGIIWIGVFAILKGDDILSTGAQSIKGYGESLGKLVAKAPLATPLPIGSGPGRPTALSLLRASHPRSLDAAISSGSTIGNALAGITRPQGTGGARNDAAIATAADAARTNTASLNALSSNLRDLASAMNDPTRRNRILGEMETRLGVGRETIRRDSIHADLAEMVRVMESRGTVIPTEIRSRLEAIRIAAAGTPPAATATPTPSPAPPTAP
jgi:hypothetical protein